MQGAGREGRRAVEAGDAALEADAGLHRGPGRGRDAGRDPAAVGRQRGAGGVRQVGGLGGEERCKVQVQKSLASDRKSGPVGFCCTGTEVGIKPGSEEAITRKGYWQPGFEQWLQVLMGLGIRLTSCYAVLDFFRHLVWSGLV